MKSYRTKYSLKHRALGWVGLLVFVPLTFFLWTENPKVAIAIIIPFALCSIYALIEGNSMIEITSEMIVQRKVFGWYGMGWNEIETIQFCVSGDDWFIFESMVLEGKNKRLSIVGPRNWGGNGAAEARQWFIQKLEDEGLKSRRTKRPLSSFPKTYVCLDAK